MSESYDNTTIGYGPFDIPTVDYDQLRENLDLYLYLAHVLLHDLEARDDYDGPHHHHGPGDNDTLVCSADCIDGDGPRVSFVYATDEFHRTTIYGARLHTHT